MTTLVPSSGFLPTTSDRRLNRSLTALHDQRVVGLARLEAVAELQACKVAAMAYVGERAMHRVAALSQLEGQLAQIVPLATSRLEALTNMTALALAEIVTETRYRLR